MTIHKLKREHWEQAKIDNQNVILQSTMQIKMAARVLAMIEEELSKFPETPKK